MDNKFMEIRKKDLETKIEKLSEIIRYNTEKQTKLLEYNQYNRNTHVALGTVIGITTFFVTKKVIDLNILSALAATIALASGTTLTTKIYFKEKQRKIKKQNPNISFENENIDKNYEKINDLFEQKFLLVEELGSVNTEIQQYENKTLPQTTKIETVEQENTKEKIKTLKRM